MKTQIKFLSVMITTLLFCVNLYSSEIDNMEPVTISKAGALLFIATKDKEDKRVLKDGAKYVYKQAKRSGDTTLISGTFRAYKKALQEKQLADIAYENARKIQNDLRRAMENRTLSYEDKYTEPSVNISYLAESFNEAHKPRTKFWGFIAKLFNLELDKHVETYENNKLSDISFEVTMNESMHDLQSKNIAITAQKIIFQW